jgi:hypothetical protein
MKVEVGKVYKCGNGYVYIEYKSRKLEDWLLNPYIGISCSSDGTEAEETHIGRFSSDGDDNVNNVPSLRHPLEELPKREIITIGSSV